tara:strand:- start:1886 stop:2122 length:237 start_codon:yes stop_codon:yes gene_type:complete
MTPKYQAGATSTVLFILIPAYHFQFSCSEKEISCLGNWSFHVTELEFPAWKKSVQLEIFSNQAFAYIAAATIFVSLVD